MAGWGRRNNLVRLNADGSFDASFDVGGGPNGQVNGIAIQSNGQIVIGGEFIHVNGVRRSRIARLHGGSAVGQLAARSRFRGRRRRF